MAKKDLDFEQCLKRLQEIVTQLENGDVSLADSLKLFEEGAGLSANCYQSLKTAEQQITEIQGKFARKDRDDAEG